MTYRTLADRLEAEDAAIVVAVKTHANLPNRPWIPVHIEITNPALAKYITPMPEERSPFDPTNTDVMGSALAEPGDRIMTWTAHDSNILLGYLMSPNQKQEEVQYRAFLRLCWQLSELRRLGYINFTAPIPLDGEGDTQ